MLGSIQGDHWDAITCDLYPTPHPLCRPPEVQRTALSFCFTLALRSQRHDGAINRGNQKCLASTLTPAPRGHASQGSREKGRQVRQQREGGGIALTPLWEWHRASFPNPVPFPSPTLHLPNGEGDAWLVKGKRQGVCPSHGELRPNKRVARQPDPY